MREATGVFYLCLERDIPPDHFKVYEIFGHNIAVRRVGGGIQIAKNACKHRGFKVMTCDQKAGSVICPYHGRPFQWANDYHIQIVGGAVFFSPKPFNLLNFDLPLGEEFGANALAVAAPFHLWMMNTADPNHLRNVHPHTFNRIFKSHEPVNVFIDGWQSEYQLPVDPEVVSKYRRYGGSEHFTHKLVGANLSITSFLDVFFSVECANPYDPRKPANWVPRNYYKDACLVETRFFIRKDVKMPELLKNLAMKNNRKILAEDEEIVSSWAHSWYGSQQTNWLPGEERIKHYCETIERTGLCNLT